LVPGAYITKLFSSSKTKRKNKAEVATGKTFPGSILAHKY